MKSRDVRFEFRQSHLTRNVHSGQGKSRRWRSETSAAVHKCGSEFGAFRHFHFSQGDRSGIAEGIGERPGFLP